MSLAERHELRPGMPPPYPSPQAGEGKEGNPPALAAERKDGAREGAATAAPGGAALSARTRILIEAPIAATLIRLAAPNVLVMVAQASVGLIETYFVGRLGNRCACRRLPGVPGRHADADDVGRRHGGRHIVVDCARARRRRAPR